MEFGIGYAARPDMWKDAVVAEDNGFSHALAADSQMVYGDVYAALALAAEHTKRIKIGTGVAIPAGRIAPVTAHSIATINQMAPGRTILGLGTGFSARNCMGLPPVSIANFRTYIETCRKLLRGEEVLYREGNRERWIRFMHQDQGFINLKDPVPIHVAANGPKALEVAGELGDGWFCVASTPENFRHERAIVERAAARAGRKLGNFPINLLSTGCVLKPGEPATSPRVLDRVGAVSTTVLHAMWESSPFGKEEAFGGLWKRYRDEYIAKMKTPADRRYLEVHEGHMLYVKPGEEEYLDDNFVRMTTLTGSGEELVALLKEYEAAGVTQVTLAVLPGRSGDVHGNARAMIEEFSKHVIAKM